MRTNPLFSIIIPTYNRAQLVRRAIDSVLRQSISAFELIVIDDGSTDNTAQMLATINDQRVKYFHQKNSGPSTARNTGAKVSNAPYLTFLDSDDEALPTWLEQLLEGFTTFQADVVCCGVIEERTKEDGHLEKEIILPRYLGKHYNDHVGLFIHGGTFAVRRTLFEALGGYIPGLNSSEHTELALRLTARCTLEGWSIHNVMEPLLRIHGHSGPRLHNDPEATYLGTLLIIEHHHEQLTHNPRVHSTYLSIAGVNAIRIGKYGEARACFRSAIQIDPFNWRLYARLLVSLFPQAAQKVWGGK